MLALVYSGLLGIAFKRTYLMVFRKDNLSRQRRIFTGFYSLVWATLILTVALYSFLKAQFFNQIQEVSLFGAFYFLPLILMVLCYVLMYYQLEIMMIRSRIESSQHFTRRLHSPKLAIAMRIIILVLLGVFVCA